MCQRCTLLPGEGLHVHEGFIFDHPVNQLTEKYFKHLKEENFTDEGCLCCLGLFSSTSCGNRKLFLLVEKG